jgi:hypothetical protein
VNVFSIAETSKGILYQGASKTDFGTHTSISTFVSNRSVQVMRTL